MTENERNAALAADPIHARGTLHAALVEARKRVTGTLLKEGRKTEGGGGNYNYVGHEHVVHHVRKAMLECGLTLVQNSLELVHPLELAGKSGPQLFLVWRASFQLAHAASGQATVMSYQCLTQANDKAGFIASTALDRTALLRLMGVAGSAEEDPEHNVNNRDERPQQSTQARVETMQGKRDGKAQATDDRVRVVNRHISDLANMPNVQGLIEWAGWLIAGDDGTHDPQMREISDEFKRPAWNAYGKRCEALGIDPTTTKAAFNAEASKLRQQGR
jgi:hypothetical protein